jgi:hypothetical protein
MTHDGDDSDMASRPVTRSQKRSEDTKRRSRRLYNDKCPLTGVIGPSIEVAHIIPWSENDDPANTIPLRVDLHKEYDQYAWRIDPTTKQPSTRKIGSEGWLAYKIIISDKGIIDYTNLSIHEHAEKVIEVRRESHRFLEEAYKRFIESEYPERIVDGRVDEPTYPKAKTTRKATSSSLSKTKTSTKKNVS